MFVCHKSPCIHELLQTDIKWLIIVMQTSTYNFYHNKKLLILSTAKKQASYVFALILKIYILMVSKLACVVFYDFVFKRFRPIIFPRTGHYFSWSRTFSIIQDFTLIKDVSQDFSTRKDFSVIKNVFHKAKVFLWSRKVSKSLDFSTKKNFTSIQCLKNFSYFNPLILDGNKRPYVLTLTISSQPQVCLSTYGLLLPEIKNNAGYLRFPLSTLL